MAPYRVKGGTVDAMQYTHATAAAMTAWCGGVERQEGQRDSYRVFAYPSLNGAKSIQEGDYLIRQSNGVLSLMAKATFEAIYEPVTVTRAGPEDFQRSMTPHGDGPIAMNGVTSWRDM